MGSTTPKQFQHLHGKPVIWYTLNTFLKAYHDLDIILVIPGEHLETAKTILRSLDNPDRVTLTTGGPSRFHSVKNGLSHINHHSIIFIHDGVRCLLSANLVHRCYEAALEHGNAIPAIQAVDSIRLETSHGNEAINREQVRLIQTPQTFRSEIIKAAFEQDFDPLVTDEASLVERQGIKIHLIDGEVSNIKITRPIDIFVAEKLLEQGN
jgi:2-C-methyl-D-erythritol 4-phosphate cytidylyltransferase